MCSYVAGLAQVMYDAGSTRLGIMIGHVTSCTLQLVTKTNSLVCTAGYSVGAAIIALFTLLFVPHSAFAVGDSGDIDWRNGAKIKSNRDHEISMKALPDDAESNVQVAGDASDTVKMLEGQRSDSYETEHATAATSSSTSDSSIVVEDAASSFQSLPFSRQARSPRHVLLLILFGTTVARMAFFFGTFNAQARKHTHFLFWSNRHNPPQLLQWFGAQDIAPLSKAFSVIMLAGGFGVFIIGPVLDKWGIAWGFFVTFATGTLWGLLQFVPSIAVQGLSWVAFALYRAFFFSAAASYMVTIFGYTNMGKVYGFCNVFSAVFSIFNNQVPPNFRSRRSQTLQHVFHSLRRYLSLCLNALRAPSRRSMVYFLEYSYCNSCSHGASFPRSVRTVSEADLHHARRYVHVILKGSKTVSAH